MKFKTLRLCVSAVNVLFACAVPVFSETFTVNDTSAPIRIDGHLTDWPSARMIRLDQKSQVTLGRAYWKGEDDFSGRVFITYDSQYLYLSVIVLKTANVVNPNDKYSLWNGDCLELFLSTDASDRRSNRLSRGDYHIGLSPGTECREPRMYCFNKNKDIPGGRVVARKAKTGYLMEACIPLVFFEGLEVGKGKTAGFNLALDQGGFSGNRVTQLDLSGDPNGWEDPAAWGNLQWMGKVALSVPVETRESLFAGKVKDGTKGAVFAGKRTVAGKVTDAKGRPLGGARISTWPKTKETIADGQGNFSLELIKVYDRTVFYARKEGYASSLSPLPPRGAAVPISLRPLPKGLRFEEGEAGQALLGWTLRAGKPGELEAALKDEGARIRSLRLPVLRLSGLGQADQTLAVDLQQLDSFVAFAKEMGAEPVIEVPVNRDAASRSAEWVRHCNLEKKYGITYWALGDAPDLDGPEGLVPRKSYDVYHYINDFRDLYNAMKRVDPSILLLGPELAWRYSAVGEDWLSPFLQYDGDIVNVASLHHHAVLNAGDLSPRAIQDDLRRKQVVLRNARNKVSENVDNYIPLAVTGGSACAQAAALKEDEDPGNFWEALWTAESIATLLRERVGLGIFSHPEGIGSGLVVKDVPGPVYWVMSLFSRESQGKLIMAQVQNANVTAVAFQDPKTRDVTLFLVNQGDRYYRAKILLNGKESSLTVDAGLDQGYDFEIPYFAAARLKLKADRSPGEAVLYTRNMAKEGKEPQISVLKPW